MIQAYPVLSQRMRDNNVSYRQLAAVINVKTFTLCLKMWGIQQWDLPEVVKICCFFNTPDAERMFLRNYNKPLFRKSQQNILKIQEDDADV